MIISSQNVGLCVPHLHQVAYNTITQQDAAVRSQFHFTVTLLYVFRVLSTPIIRSTLTVFTASGTGHTSVQLLSSIVAEFISL